MPVLTQRARGRFGEVSSERTMGVTLASVTSTLLFDCEKIVG